MITDLKLSVRFAGAEICIDLSGVRKELKLFHIFNRNLPTAFSGIGEAKTILSPSPSCAFLQATHYLREGGGFISLRSCVIFGSDVDVMKNAILLSWVEMFK